MHLFLFSAVLDTNNTKANDKNRTVATIVKYNSAVGTPWYLIKPPESGGSNRLSYTVIVLVKVTYYLPKHNHCH